LIENYEADISIPDEIKPYDSIILDATELAKRYIRPEKDLLAFTEDDLALIEGNYVKAYAHLDNIMVERNIDDHNDNADESIASKRICLRSKSNRNKALRPFFKQRVGKL